jgi:hypothetical protein
MMFYRDSVIYFTDYEVCLPIEFEYKCYEL